MSEHTRPTKAERDSLRAQAQRELDIEAHAVKVQPWRAGSLSRRTVVVVDAESLLWLLDAAEEGVTS